MAEQISTPVSPAESSLTGKAAAGAPKDKACPFCQQPFTSSSLGRHLDLYVKEKNPKPSDGVHDVDEIRKMRGAITRRQPRNSSSRRGDSTPVGTPGTSHRAGSPRPANDTGTRSPSLVTRQPMVDHKGKVTTLLNTANWQSTGVINNIPFVHQRNELNNGDGNGNAGDGTPGKRFVNRQMLAKSTFDQKQKMMEALDNARAAELALREILGSIKAAVVNVQPHSSPFDFDPLTLDFPTLCLTCLPPPPTINQLTPLSSPSSWSITPPAEPQYEALTAYFRDAFHAAHITRTIISSIPPHSDDILFAHHSAPSMQATLTARAQEFEDKVSKHLHCSFSYWVSLPPPNRTELWKLELARAVGQKDQQITALKEKMEITAQENRHLMQQVEYLSRCQQPREFQMCPPSTLPIGPRTAVELGEMGIRGGSVGWRLDEGGENLQKRVEVAVGRWREVVRSSRGAGMQGQRSMSGQQHPQTPQGQQHANGQANSAHMANGGASRDDNAREDMDLDAEGDADADADPDEDSYGNQLQDQLQQAARAPEAPMMGGGYGNNHNAMGRGNGAGLQQQQQGSHNGNHGHEAQNGAMGRRPGGLVAGVAGRAGGRTMMPY